jgi:hypothetical protein
MIFGSFRRECSLGTLPSDREAALQAHKFVSGPI